VRPFACCRAAVGRSPSWLPSWASRRSRYVELRRLRRENRVLAEEREILKKAAAFFATDSSRAR
jgi:transposase-like protein